MKVIYSNCKGSYLIENGIADSVLFDKKDAVDRCIQLEKGEIIDEEKKLAKKYPAAVFLNRKTDNVQQLENQKEIGRMLALFTGHSHEFFGIELELAKRKIRESVKFDNLIVNASDSVEELSRCINLLSKRMREWYGLANPELSRKTGDNVEFAEKILENPPREEGSMGAELKNEDTEPVKILAEQIIQLNRAKEQQEKYIDISIKANCPNLQAVAGSNLGAKLIALAGSFGRLAKMPASTIQILGAEKALFRHIKTGAKSPKHGIIVQHPLVISSGSKGMASRQVADKISIAVKIDFFRGEFIGDKLAQGLAKKLGG